MQNSRPFSNFISIRHKQRMQNSPILKPDYTFKDRVFFVKDDSSQIPATLMIKYFTVYLFDYGSGVLIKSLSISEDFDYEMLSSSKGLTLTLKIKSETSSITILANDEAQKLKIILELYQTADNNIAKKNDTMFKPIQDDACQNTSESSTSSKITNSMGSTPDDELEAIENKTKHPQLENGIPPDEISEKQSKIPKNAENVVAEILDEREHGKMEVRYLKNDTDHGLDEYANTETVKSEQLVNEDKLIAELSRKVKKHSKKIETLRNKYVYKNAEVEQPEIDIRNNVEPSQVLSKEAVLSQMEHSVIDTSQIETCQKLFKEVVFNGLESAEDDISKSETSQMVVKEDAIVSPKTKHPTIVVSNTEKSENVTKEVTSLENDPPNVDISNVETSRKVIHEVVPNQVEHSESSILNTESTETLINKGETHSKHDVNAAEEKLASNRQINCLKSETDHGIVDEVLEKIVQKLELDKPNLLVHDDNLQTVTSWEDIEHGIEPCPMCSRGLTKSSIPVNRPQQLFPAKTLEASGSNTMKHFATSNGPQNCSSETPPEKITGKQSVFHMKSTSSAKPIEMLENNKDEDRVESAQFENDNLSKWLSKDNSENSFYDLKSLAVAQGYVARHENETSFSTHVESDETDSSTVENENYVSVQTRNKPWLQEGWNRKEAEHFVRGRPTGTFIVRRRTDLDANACPYAITLAFNKVPVHIKIMRHMDGELSLAPYKKGDLSFETLDSLVERYQDVKFYFTFNGTQGPIALRRY